jgi:hypothetical protein
MSDVHQPPRLAETLLSKVVGSDDREAIMGDLAEEYGLRREASGVAAADRWYWRQTVLTLVQGRIRRPLRALLLTVVILPAWWLLLREVFQFLIGTVSATGALTKRPLWPACCSPRWSQCGFAFAWPRISSAAFPRGSLRNTPSTASTGITGCSKRRITLAQWPQRSSACCSER